MRFKSLPHVCGLCGLCAGSSGARAGKGACEGTGDVLGSAGEDGAGVCGGDGGSDSDGVVSAADIRKHNLPIESYRELQKATKSYITLYR
jgi:hypothetical protein